MSRLAHTANMFPARYAGAQQMAGTKFSNIRFFRKLYRLNDGAFKGYLLENMETSGKFIEWYTRVLARMKAEDAKETIRSVLRDEVPNGKPTHFEDLIADLKRIGISEDILFSHRPSNHTTSIIDQIMRLSCDPSLSDLERLVVLHIAGERLASLEYCQIAAQVAVRFELIGRQLRFYTPHAEHDAKKGLHDQAFMTAITGRIQTSEDLAIAMRMADQAMETRLFFFEQFNRQ